ncbi:methyl-accepting chemotaxis protein [Vibrio sp. LaRot3]|uniref:methyl-accepting chemotaxis protein n=1 Tax=Vibrio sp. LaRot3 TaxID=2998829 RepID=UPI0022CDC791|nr:methyl-accepting chemotaxis protein [Vibrio sp. LaRot3]MDA0150041.1 methyl-accepting chemotaxis protein [Vibrio sp. LaRot3]
MSKWTHLSIRTRIYVTFSLLTLLSISSVALYLGFHDYDLQKRTLVEDTIPKQLDSLGAKINNSLLPSINYAMVLTESLRVAEWLNQPELAADTSSIQTSFSEIKALSDADILFLTAQSAYGQEYYSEAFGGFKRQLLADYVNGNFYGDFLNTGKKYELTLDEVNGENFLFINYRSNALKHDSNEPLVVAGLGVNVNNMVTLVQTHNVGQHGNALLVDEFGHVDVRPDQSVITADNSEEALAGLLDKSQAYQVETRTINGKSYFVATHWVETVQRFAVLEIPTSQLMAPMVTMAWKTLFVALIVGGIAMAIMFLLVRALVQPLQQLTQGIEKVASQLDLSQRIEVDDEAEIGDVAKQFNQLLDTLRQALCQVKFATNHSAQSADTLKANSDQVNYAAEQQQSSLDNIAATTQQINVALDGLAHFCAEIKNVSQSGQQSLISTQSVMNSSVNSTQELQANMEKSQHDLHELNIHTDRILKVLEVISAISEQTNLLALNAAIEAARAGEHGRGFAVVADEVRSLSQRTHTSTTEIQEIINSLMAAAANVTEQMKAIHDSSESSLTEQQQAADSLGELHTNLSKLFNMNTKIAEETSACSSSLNAISGDIDNIVAQGHQSENLLLESKSASNKIVAAMQGLSKEVDNFKGVA